MFRSAHRRHGLQGLHGLHGLQRIVDFADGIHANGPWRQLGFHPRPQPRLSLGRVLLAGLAVLAFVKLMSVANRSNRSKATTIVLGVLLVALGAIVMSFRRSAARARW